MVSFNIKLNKSSWLFLQLSRLYHLITYSIVFVLARASYYTSATTDLLARFCSHFFSCLLNTKSPWQFTFDVSINSSLILAWLFLVKFVNVVPKTIRPRIFHRLCVRIDQYMFENPLGWLLSVQCLVAGAYLLYNRYYIVDHNDHHDEIDDCDDIYDEIDQLYAYAPSQDALAHDHSFNSPPIIKSPSSTMSMNSSHPHPHHSQGSALEPNKASSLALASATSTTSPPFSASSSSLPSPTSSNVNLCLNPASLYTHMDSASSSSTLHPLITSPPKRSQSTTSLEFNSPTSDIEMDDVRSSDSFSVPTSPHDADEKGILKNFGEKHAAYSHHPQPNYHYHYKQQKRLTPRSSDDSQSSSRYHHHHTHPHNRLNIPAITNHWHATPPVLLALSLFLLQFVYQFNSASSIEKSKFIFSWVIYVLLHFLMPIITGIWLHAFHVPGALKLFVLSCGLQNCLVVFTHLVFPNAPPLFIKLYGENLTPSYDMTYTDGITRQDIKVGNYIYKSVYYAAPNKFSCLPSLHSAMAVMIFLFVSHYSRWHVVKVAAFAHLILQWWASIYLDHHWRVDLLAGAIYSIAVFTMFKFWKRHGLVALDNRFRNARSRFDPVRGSTFGMRLFRHTSWQRAFDPLS